MYTYSQKYASLYTLFEPKFALLHSKLIIQVLTNPFLNTGKTLRFDTSSSIAFDENSTVDLLVIGFLLQTRNILR